MPPKVESAAKEETELAHMTTKKRSKGNRNAAKTDGEELVVNDRMKKTAFQTPIQPSPLTPVQNMVGMKIAQPGINGVAMPSTPNLVANGPAANPFANKELPLNPDKKKKKEK